MTDKTYRWFVERCLKLELEIAVLKGLEAERAPIERRDLYELAAHAATPVVPKHPRRLDFRATDEGIMRIRELKRQGLSNPQIGKRAGCSEHTVRRYTRDIGLEREVGR
jgi:DNA-binding NarL/FixJ family response regulator